MAKTKIEWCDETINPVVGCTFGCEYCYAARLNKRFKYIEDWSKPQFFPERLEQISKLKKPKNIFINSMSDVADWKSDWMRSFIDVMETNKQHNYLLLTKRPEKRIIVGKAPWLWLGTSITKQSEVMRLDYLTRRNVVKNYFISIEPLHGEIDLEIALSKRDLRYHLKWIIIGAETGNRNGKIVPKHEWLNKLYLVRDRYDIPIFMKDSMINIVGKENMLREFPKGLMKE